jgi:hypothetical protein
MLKPWSAILVAIGIAIIVLLALCAKSHAECLRSAQAVWNAHDGAHATWSMRHGEKCWYARGREYRAEAKVVVNQGVPLPRPAVRSGQVPVTAVWSPPTPRGLVMADHDQFITWSSDSALDTDVSALVFLQDRMIAAGWRLWLQASVERYQDAQGRLLPLR